MTLSDSELDSLGRVNSDGCGLGTHEWSEWVNMPTVESVHIGEGYYENKMGLSPIKIRVCKKCKKLEGDLA
jgi:hypothetical protein